MGRPKTIVSEEIISLLSFLVDSGATNADILEMLSMQDPPIVISRRTLSQILADNSLVEARPGTNLVKHL